MELTVNRVGLERELRLARRLGERKATIPVLGYALLQTDNGSVRISATDGESALRTSCAAIVVVPGSTLVPVKTLHDIAKAATSDDVELKTDGTRVSVKAGAFRSKLAAMSVEDFPDLPAAPLGVKQMPAAQLRGALLKVRSVVEEAATRGGPSHIHGALFQPIADELRVVATDGRRLTLVKVQAAGLDAAEDQMAILPRKALEDLAELVGVDTSIATVGYVRDESRAYFEVGPRQLATRVIDAKFPAYERVIPASGNGAKRVEVDRDALLAALRRVMLVSTQESLKVALRMADGEILASMGAAEIGDAAEPVPAQVQTDGWESAFNAQYLSDFLQAADSGTVVYEQRSPQTAGRFESVLSGVEYVHVLMPIFLQGGTA